MTDSHQCGDRLTDISPEAWLTEHYPRWEMTARSMESRLLDPDFAYSRPWFYNQPWALRCELGLGDDYRSFTASAQSRAEAIAAILFVGGQSDVVFADMVMAPNGKPMCRVERKRLGLLTARYRTMTVPNIAVSPLDDEENALQSRFIFYRDDANFDMPAVIAACFDERGSTLHFLSRSADCVMSIYDSRGCDIVFATPAAMLRHYGALETYFLEYDRVDMEVRRRMARVLCGL